MSTPDEDQPDGSADQALSRTEQERVQEGAAPRAVLVHEIIRREGEDELLRPVSALALSGLAAGLSMGFSFLAQAFMMAELPDPNGRALLAPLGYCVGFLIVVMGRQQLFTESTLTALLPLLYRRDLATMTLTIRLWAIVLAANLLGTMLFALAIAGTDVADAQQRSALTELALKTIEGSFGGTLVKAIFAGWLIALMVWLLPAAGSAKILIIVVLTYVVALGGFAHVVAGSAEAAFLVVSGEAGPGDYLVKFLLPTLIGNTIGGVALVAMLNHGSVSAELATTPGASG
ncbi:formate/nitrite transporter family protein [Hansschlegelia beijingensis]|uniref:Formate/nitrite transporter FocA (FNT family) n=1 Tax=Hansschlegelia beijingensis TaxID=1133344 RepID=A0A7W6D3Y6_9HYPH|nr:formate/nitrite transporter family protein [Hansschlegelia beijingensis]MBB3972733.1 formate/nitrite transporter FocA (FNT family) [Hansschlegelia beijingensis]